MNTTSEGLVEASVAYHPGLYTIDSLVLGIAIYITITHWIYYFKKYGCHVGQKSTRDLIETILLSVTSTVMLPAAVGHIIQRPLQRNIFNTLYGVSLLMAYIILWLRQRPLYTNRTLGHLSNKVSRFISKYCIIYIIVADTILLVIITVIRSSTTCIDECYEHVLLAILIVGPLSVQIPLLCLVVVPLCKHHRANQVTNQNFVNLIKRLVVLTTVCVLSDVTTAIVRVYANVLVFTPYQLNLLVNLLCVTFAPFNWKTKVFPCYATQNVSAAGDSVSSDAPRQSRSSTTQIGEP